MAKKKGAGPNPGVPVVLPVGGPDGDIVAAMQLRRLVEAYRVPAERAAVIAGLAWQEVAQ